MGDAGTNPDQIERAIRWLIDNPREKRPTASTPLLKELFGLSPIQAVAVIRRANAIRYGHTEGGTHVDAS